MATVSNWAEQTIQKFKVVSDECTGVLEPFDPLRAVRSHDVEQKQIGVDERPFGAVFD